ncbi:MAG: FAD-dependent oxidoreductase, partial [Acidimicrobiia bacterium]
MHDVIVVGAGVAGLTAASQLNTAGLDVVVLEARDRIGGRTHTQTLGDATVDMGAAWLHDPLHNPLSPYLDSLGIPVQS